MKTYILFFSIILFSFTTYKNLTQDSLEYTITKIDFLDDGNPIIYIKTDSLQGIIIEDNKSLHTKKATKIELGKKYSISLIRIDYNYRGSTTYYSIASSKGTEKIIWREKDGLPLVLYRATNLNGLWLIKN